MEKRGAIQIHRGPGLVKLDPFDPIAARRQKGPCMIDWFRQLDRLLRGDATRMEALRGGIIDLRAGGLTLVAVLLGVIYGLCMGVFSLTGSGSGAPLQIIASAIKVPALFFLTLLVTFP